MIPMSKASQVERESREIAGGHAVVESERRPLYGHDSPETSYFVADYPYGFQERTQIRYWLEHKPKKGWRWVSQTKNPKSGSWNKPKQSTYADLGAAMYLDPQGHVQWIGVGAYSKAEDILRFVEEFPGAEMSELRRIAPMKLRYLRGMISGEMFFTINGVRQPVSEADVARMKRELAIWERIQGLIA